MGTLARGWCHTYPVLAASLLEGTQQHGSVAALLQVAGHVLPRDAGRPALVGAGHGVPGTLVLVVLGTEDGSQVVAPRTIRVASIPRAPSHLDGVEDKLLGAVGAGLRALGALGQGVLGQQAPHHARPALVLAVHALLGTRPLVALGTAAAAAASPTTARICPHGQDLSPRGPPSGSPMATLHPLRPCYPPLAICVSPSRPGVSPTPVPTSKASPVKSVAQNSHLTLRLGQPCCTCSGRSRRLSLALQRLGQGTTLKAQVPRWTWGRRDGQRWGGGSKAPPRRSPRSSPAHQLLPGGV